MATRRGFLATLLAAGTMPSLGWADAGSPAYLACARQMDGSFALHGLGTAGEARFAIALPARGHAGCGHPTQALAVVFARRPGSYALVVDCAVGDVRHRLAPPEGRQFNGHGAFLDRGDVLATSEQDAETSEGIVGLWDVRADWTRIGEVSTGGIGPHELRRLPNGRLLIANGGIATDPTDRTKLNVATMRPNLAVLDPFDPASLEIAELDPDLSQLSIRHLALWADGRAAFAMQWEGEPDRVVPLLGLRAVDGGLTLAHAPEAEAMLMQGYAGSIAISGDETAVAISSPKGGRVQRFDADGTYLGAFARPEACGLASHLRGFLVSDGLGGLIALDSDGAAPLGHMDCAWDNHVVAL